jgi:hypothetical protein
VLKQTPEFLTTEVADADGFGLARLVEPLHGFPSVNIVDVLRGSLVALLGEELVTTPPGYWPVL